MTGPILSVALSGSPRMWKLTIAEWRSGEIWSALPRSSGLSIPVTTGIADSRRTTSAVAAVNVGLDAVCERLWMRTVSLARVWTSRSTIFSIRPDSPGEVVFGLSCFVPTAPPMTTAAMTKAIQPKVAVFQCEALQRPARAARFRLMTASRKSFGVMSRRCLRGLGWTMERPGVFAWGRLRLVVGDNPKAAYTRSRAVRGDDRPLEHASAVARDRRLVSIRRGRSRPRCCRRHERAPERRGGRVGARLRAHGRARRVAAGARVRIHPQRAAER